METIHGGQNQITLGTGDVEDNVLRCADTPLIGIAISIREYPLKPKDQPVTAFLDPEHIRILSNWLNRRYLHTSQDALNALADAALDAEEKPADAFILGFEAGQRVALTLADEEARAALDMWNDVISDCDDGVVGMQKAFTVVAELREAQES
ncbi:MAG: hypothetical protein LKI98_04240 [Bifidobacterium crudilactis]|nr:hypothetical protein [Bifidobacterium crudilactis]